MQRAAAPGGGRAQRLEAPPADTAAVVLCAGAGSRYAREGAAHKLLSPFRGRPLVAWALEAAVAAGFPAVLVVTGAVDLSRLLPREVTEVRNDRWREGQATSLAAGLAAAGRAGFRAVVVGLGDQPLVTSSCWRALAASDAPVAVATYGGTRRNPVRLASSVWHELPSSGDVGARALMAARPELVVEVPCAGDPVDVDRPGDAAPG